MTERHPCANCPWRRDAPRGHWDPDHFRSIWHNCQDDGLALMLCHKTATREVAPDTPCAGAVLVLGFQSIGIRLAAGAGRVVLSEYVSRVPLFADMAEMLRANGVRLPPRNRVKP